MLGAMSSSHVYCCIDVEASGPVPALYDLVSIGAVAVVRLADGRHAVASHEAFYCELKPQGGAEDEGATRVHGLTREHLRKNGIELAEGLARLNAWAEAVRGASGARLVFVGHNAPFDWSFVHYSYHAAKVPSPWGWKALDTKALAMGVLGLDWFDTNKETLARLLPALGDQDERLVHRADYDALYQARILAALLDHPGMRP
jgi:DNA polymerase III alpha subunit (gram-positive type)